MANALGMTLGSDLPEGAAVLEVLVVAKYMDSDGETALYQSCSDGLRIWDAVGMATGLLDQLRSGLQNMFEAGDDGDADG